MRRTEISLSEPFPEVLASLLALPSTHTTDGLRFTGATGAGKNRSGDAEVEETLRSLYEAAHGRQVETQIGSVAIAPPLAGFLKEAPFYVATQYEFFLEAFTRILARESAPAARANGSSPGRRQITNRREKDVPAVVQGENGNALLGATASSFASN